MPGVVSTAKSTRSVAQWSGLSRAAALVAAAGVCYAAAYGIGTLTDDGSNGNRSPAASLTSRAAISTVRTHCRAPWPASRPKCARVAK